MDPVKALAEARAHLANIDRIYWYCSLKDKRAAATLTKKVIATLMIKYNLHDAKPT